MLGLLIGVVTVSLGSLVCLMYAYVQVQKTRELPGEMKRLTAEVSRREEKEKRLRSRLGESRER
jgi:hypothetical protein